MQTKTHSELVRRASRALGNGTVIHSGKTEHNPLGQSGIHTFVDDVIDVVLNSKDEAEAFKKLHDFLMEGFVEIK